MFDPHEKVGIYRLAGLDLDRDQPAGSFDQQINLVPGTVAPEVEVQRQAAVEPAFEKFGNNPVLEQCAAQRVRFELFRCADCQQPTRQPGIVKIEFRGLDDAFVEVAVMGLEHKNHKTRFQDGQPRPRSVVRDTGLGPEL